MSPTKKQPRDGDRDQKVGRRQRPPDKGDAVRPRRRRGGQPSNLNAWKHGLYARTLTPDALRALQIARGLKATDLTEEISGLRARLAVLTPSEAGTFHRGVALVIRAAQAQHRMSPQASKDLATNLIQILNSLGDQLLHPPDP